MTAAWEPQARWKSNWSLEITSQVRKVEITYDMQKNQILNDKCVSATVTLVDLAQEDLNGI